MSFHVSLVRCSDGSLYVGHTDDLESRVVMHNSGEISGYTKSRRPVRLLWLADFPTRYEALTAERQLKGWSRAKKLALARNDWEAIKRLARSRGSTGSPRTVRRTLTAP